ncbi:MAG: flagellar filament capping protein FliD [Rubrivivax sp.]
MPAIQSLGVGSGLDANSIVTQLMAVERRPLTQLQKSASSVQTQISVYGNVKSRLDTLQTALDKVKLASNWVPTTVDNGGSTSVAATVSGSPATGDVTVSVSQLAQSQSVASKSFTTSTLTGSGALKITLGKWNPGFANFTARVPAASLSVQIDASPTPTLESVRDSINAAVAQARAAKLATPAGPDFPEVTASVVKDAGGSRLVVQSSLTGIENGFEISSGTPAVTGTLQDLLFQNSGGTPPPATGQVARAAANLAATVNGVPVSLASNTLTDVVQGLTLEAKAVTTTEQKLTVTRDTEAIKKNIADFITAYNDLVTYTAQQTNYDATTKKGGPLQGDRTALSLLAQLRQTATNATSASTAFSGTTGQASRLADVGITLQRDGTLKSDGSKLDKAVSNLTELTKMFTQVNTTNTANQGVAQNLATLVRTIGGVDGSITSRQSGLSASLTRNQSDQSRINDRLTQVEARLRAQYTALDKRMSGITGLGQYINMLTR